MAKKKKGKKKVGGTGALPPDFLVRVPEIYGQRLARDIEKTFVTRPTTFRVNAIRSDVDEVLAVCQRSGLKVQRVPWYSDAFVLTKGTKRDLTALPLYEEGKIYIQSLASMVPPLVLAPQAGERVLDLTAAPGSKTSQIAALMQQQGELVANDNNKVRFFRLKHNMEHLGVVAENKDGWQFDLRLDHGIETASHFEGYFDKILLDAPCSAEARFVEGDPKTVGYWKERKVKEMAYKQRGLLLAAWGALQPGGSLVYSTCTFSPEENEMQVDRLLGRVDDAVVVPVDIPQLQVLPGITSWRGKTFDPQVAQTARIVPTKDIEGFYVAHIKKQSRLD